jgi:ubiquinone/menaquinone biosynthesis C-methylase UbiE
MGNSKLEHNIKVHNRIAKRYEKIHGEIYNHIEQKRLREKLAVSVSSIDTKSDPCVALDFGCGAGNLTKHLSDLGCEVIAADVSTGFLDLIRSRKYKKRVTTLQLNGKDLSSIPDESVDMVAMYSVLHHVPDYLSLMSEFARVLKRGGIIYIDHEASEAMWQDGELAEFTRQMKKKQKRDIGKYFVLTNYIDRIIRMFIDPTYQREGDIHVFPNDHIEWDKIRSELARVEVAPVLEEDYLLYRRSYDHATYESWKGNVGDMHLYIGKKA